MKYSIVILFYILSFTVQANNCDFFMEYAEIFHKEKIKKTRLNDAVTSVLFVMRSSDDYNSLDTYERKSFDRIIRDLGNQIYIDDSDTIEESRGKARAYCEHNANEIARTQVQRITYCQKKGMNSEIISILSKRGVQKEELINSIGEIENKNGKTIEYLETMKSIDEIYELEKSNPDITPGQIGEMVYKECLITGG